MTGGHFIAVRGQVFDETTLDDDTANDFRPGQDTWLHDDAAGCIAVERGLYQGEVEVESAVALHEMHDVLHAFPDAVADDEQQELTASQVPADVVHELRFVDAGCLRADQFVGGIAFAPERSRHFALQILVVPRRELLGVVQDLPDHLPTRLRISPELKLRQDQPAKRVNVEGIYVARWRGEFAADGHWVRVGGVDRPRLAASVGIGTADPEEMTRPYHHPQPGFQVADAEAPPPRTCCPGRTGSSRRMSDCSSSRQVADQEEGVKPGKAVQNSKGIQ